MLLHSWFSFIWYATWPCSEKVHFDLLTHKVRGAVGGGGGGRGGGKIFATMLLHYFVIAFSLICNMTLFWKKWTLTCWPLGSGVPAKYLLKCCNISWLHLTWYATWPCAEKMKSDISTLSPYGLGEWGSVGKIFATMLLHFVISFNLICNMNIIWKFWIFTHWPIPHGGG